MTIQEAIEIIEADKHKNHAYEMAISVLQKEIPQYPDFKWGTTYLCPPDCGGVDEDEYGYIAYCPCCGNKLDSLEIGGYCHKCKQNIAVCEPPRMEGEG